MTFEYDGDPTRTYNSVVFATPRQINSRFRDIGIFNIAGAVYNTYLAKIFESCFMDVYDLDLPMIRQVKIDVM